MAFIGGYNGISSSLSPYEYDEILLSSDYISTNKYILTKTGIKKLIISYHTDSYGMSLETVDEINKKEVIFHKETFGQYTRIEIDCNDSVVVGLYIKKQVNIPISLQTYK